jgi:hypothetical protein
MRRFISPAFYAVLVCLFITHGAFATTYYIASNGSDSNNGTSKTTPWMHAPGMPSCTGTCSSTTPKAGDKFIFRGGDTWHYGTGSPLIGGAWNWKWSGSSGNPIYIGVDQTWYSGSSFARPVLNGDNPLSTSFVGSCAYDDSNLTGGGMIGLSDSWVTFDNFEVEGVCWSGSISNHGIIYQAGGSSTNDTISNFYCHGWTMTSSSNDQVYCINAEGGGNLADGNQYAYDIFDGSDSPHFAAGDTTNCHWVATDGCASGQGIYGRAYDVHNSIFRYLSNFMVTLNTTTVHDNLFEYLYFSYQQNGQHPNVLNNLGGPAGTNLYFYNNILRHTYSTENIYLAVRTNAYIFNNVFYDNMNTQFGVLPTGCIYLNASPGAASTQAVYIYNNTLGDASCKFNPAGVNSPLGQFNGSVSIANNHIIGSGSTSASSIISNQGGIFTVTDKGNEVIQTAATATSQGYSSSNNYAPTSATASTVGAGQNMTSYCATFSPDSALCSGTSDAVAETSGDGGKVAAYPAIPIVSRASDWDAGAYQFSASTKPPGPATALDGVAK